VDLRSAEAAAQVALPDDVLAWAAERAGAAVSGGSRMPGGGRKEAWVLQFERPDGERFQLFLRYDRSDPDRTADPWTLHREASVFVALQDAGILVPRVLGVHPEHQAMLSELVVGDAWFSRITDPDEAVRTARHFMEQLAAWHRLDVRRLELPYFPEPTTVPDMVEWELDEWDRIIERRGGNPDPLLAFALGWLRRNIPDVDAPVVLVQGDTGPGNFIYRDGRVLAVVDWELAHLGDPMDDIAWLTLRCTQTPFPDLPARLAEYEALVGWEVDETRVRYYQVLAETKLLVMGHRPGGEGRPVVVEGGGADIGNGLIYGMLHRRLWFEAAASFLGLALDEPVAPPPAAAGEHAWLYDAVLSQLREVVVPRIGDPLAQARTKGIARVVKYLREVDRHGDHYAADELADIVAVLDECPRSLAEARAALTEAVRSGRIGDRDYLQLLWRRASRDNELLRSASGVLADRHWPALR
jgi:aminoglycoside phosphotransferase (APT) family kinase protein